MSVLGQWCDEVKRVTPDGMLSTLCHYANDRATTVAALQQYDVVVTTYGVLAAEMQACNVRPVGSTSVPADALPYVRLAGAGAFRRQPVLLGVHWRRVVLDEAHTIKNRVTEVQQARGRTQH